MLAKRHQLMRKGYAIEPGRLDIGGIHFRGLCQKCNTRAGKYDGAYGAFSDALAPCWVKSMTLYVPPRITLPEVDFDPGGVVRSILLGMRATSGLFKEHWPDFPTALAEGHSVELPSEMRLYLAPARGRSALVAGSMFGFHVAGPNVRRRTDGSQIGINAIASVYFPPLAWELNHTGDTILTEHGWTDVSSWTQLPPDETNKLTELVPSLPATYHPWHHPDLNDHWTELLNTQLVDVTNASTLKAVSRIQPRRLH
jgi:hypothetical protein